MFPKQISNFLKWSQQDRVLFIRAYVSLALARLALQILPFRWVAVRCGTPQVETPIEGLSPSQRDAVRRVARAVRTASRYTPWESSCLPQAIVAVQMLRRHNVASTLYFGVSKSETAIRTGVEAHAWVRSGKFYVVGGDGHRDYTVISFFGSL